MSFPTIRTSAASVMGICTLLIATAVSATAQGTLVLQDSTRFGPNSVVLDTRTQLLWLTTAHTVNYSYLAALGATGSGGVFDGFRHATVQEVDGLLQSAGLPVGGQIFESDPRLAPLPAFIGMFGRTEIFNGRDHLVGITGSAASPNPPSGLWREAGVHFVFSQPESFYRMGAIGAAISGDIGSPALANWMVMQVPEPATWLLIAAGGLAAFFARRRPTPTVGCLAANLPSWHHRLQHGGPPAG